MEILDKNGRPIMIGNVLKTPYDDFVIVTSVRTDTVHWVDAQHVNASGVTHAKTTYLQDHCIDCDVDDPDPNCKTCGGTGYMKNPQHGIDSFEVVASNVKAYIKTQLQTIFPIIR